jgi:hypothetical protein
MAWSPDQATNLIRVPDASRGKFLQRGQVLCRAQLFLFERFGFASLAPDSQE